MTTQTNSKLYDKLRSNLGEANAAWHEAERAYIMAQNEHREAVANATTYYAKRIERQRDVIRAVLTKCRAANPDQGYFTPLGYEWVAHRGAVSITSLDERKVTIEVKTGLKTSETFTLNSGILFLSDRELAKQTRAYYRKQVEAKILQSRKAELAKLEAEAVKLKRAVEAAERDKAARERELERTAARLERLKARAS